MNENQPTSNRIEIVSPGFGLEASYFAAALAREFVVTPSAERPDVVLVDGLRGCGGLDVVCDLETQEGVRWPSLRGARGSVDAQMLLDSLPTREGLGVLSHSQTSNVVCTPEVTALISDALSEQVSWLVETRRDEDVPQGGNVLVLVHGSICALAAAQVYLRQCSAQANVGLVLLETPVTQRAMVEETLGAPVVAHAPTRWHMAPVAVRNILNGQWPHQGDRAFAALVKDSAIYVRSQGRCLAWA